MSATPRPWRRDAGIVSGREGIVCILAEPEGRWIPDDARPAHLGSPRFDEAMDNGDLIIRAVNAYDALAAALREVEESEHDAEGRRVLTNATMVKVRAALKLVTEGP